MQKRYEMDMTTGPFLKKIFIFAIPMVLTGLLQLLYNTADVVVVGKFAGETALAAVGSTGSLINLILNVFIGLSMGSGVMVARYIGAKDDENIHKCTHTALCISLCAGFFVCAVGFFCSRQLLIWMNAPEDVLDQATLYLKIYFLGAPASLFYNFGAAVIRATGDTKRPLLILGLTGLVNVGLNLILVICFHMDVAGVAIATITAQYLSAVSVVYILLRVDNACRLQVRKLRFHKRSTVEIIRIGLPAGVQSALFSVSNVIIQSTVNSFGTTAMAGIAAGSNVDGYIFTCTNAIAQTSMNFSSQNIGAQKYENVPKVYRYCLGIAFLAATVLSAIAFIFRVPIVGLFSDEAEVIAIGADRLTLILPFYFFCSLMDVTAGQVRGMGRSVEPMVISLLGACGSRILWVYTVLPLNRTLTMLYWSYPVSWGLTFIAQICFYLYAAKKLKKQAASVQVLH